MAMVDRKEWGMFARGAHQLRWLRGLFLALLAAMVVSSCGGGSGSQEQDSAEGTTTTTEDTDQAINVTVGDSGQAPEDALNAALEQSFSESEAPGVVAAVQTPQYTWVRALGVADTTSKAPMTPEVHHRIGSVTKTFTLSLLLHAAAEGLISLDDTIDQYVDSVPNGDKITLRQMANMTSGIASYTENKQWDNEFFSDHERVWKPEELVQVGLADSPLFDPGTQWHYSNTNTVMLGLVLEQVTGEPIDQLYRERIIEPLGLTGTSFPGADPSLPDPHAQGYTLQGQSSGAEPVDATNWNPSPDWTAGEIISTVEDLLVYGRALGTGEGLLPSEQQIERLNSFVSDLPPLNQPPLEGYLAYGIGLGNDHGWIGHNGQTPGYTTYLFYNPDLDAVVVVEVNSDIPSGECPTATPTMADQPRGITCHTPADRIFSALTEALGKPAPSPAGT
jgi:D-alanyl-D-alanine carboxypeptidase